MVTRIFAEHGVWWGSQMGYSCGYATYENQVIRSALKRLYGVAVEPPLKVHPRNREILRVAEATVPEGRRWCHKCGCQYFPALVELFPQAKFIYVRRNLEDAAVSVATKRNAKVSVARPIIQKRFEYMAQLQREHGGVFVDTDKVVAGNYSDLRQAFDYCEIEFDPALADRGIVK